MTTGARMRVTPRVALRPSSSAKAAVKSTLALPGSPLRETGATIAVKPRQTLRLSSPAMI